ncbi:gene transfer agent portal protein [Oceanotoga phage vB_OteS-UFV02]
MGNFFKDIWGRVNKAFSGKISNYDINYEYYKKIYPDWDNYMLQKSMEDIGIVYRCVRTISDDISTITWKLYKERNKNSSTIYEEVRDGDLNFLLKRPNPYLTFSDLLWIVVANMNLIGEGILVKRKGLKKEGSPIMLEPLNPINYVLKLDERNNPLHWENISKPNDTPIPYKDTLHFKFNNPASIYRGLSPMRAARLAAQNAKYAAEFNRNFYYNSANPSGAFVLPEGNTLSDAEFKRLQNQIVKAYTGIKNTGLPVILENGMDFKKFQMSHQELQYSENRKEDNKEVGLVFGVPEAKLYGTSTTYASSIQAEKDYNKYTLLPIMRQIKQVINNNLIPDFYGSFSKYELTFDEFVAEDVQFKTSKVVRFVKSGIITINEARQEMGYPKSDDPKADELNITYLDTDFDANQEAPDENTTQM